MIGLLNLTESFDMGNVSAKAKDDERGHTARTKLDGYGDNFN